MRFAAYAGTSVVLATGTVARAFYERANFYSASVAIAQSNASLMILTNVALLGVSMFMLGLQRIFYGPLRPIEIEQLYEKAWFAITETCLAMTIFREEVGGWFLVMFVSLLIGKVWGWIGEGRVEILEQQPPANPRLFHAQLSVSLLISSLFDFLMLQYAVNTVLLHARPNMMVMFAFEFAVLTVTSLSTAARYSISVFEASVIKKQTNERRAQMRRDRQQAQLDTARSQGSSEQVPPLGTAASEDDIDAMDIDAPGWEEKGRWIFYLDLTTDFLKLALYLTFFCVLCMFYGMPIHIIRDVALTIRSFYKRLLDFFRYRKATRDMNTRYPDATPEEIAREDVCIICREDMRPWPQPVLQNGQPAGNEATNVAAASPVDERSRPKKLPCGHILHFACLRGWLERQQNCPTCRRPVLVPDAGAPAQTPNLPHQQARVPPQNVLQPQLPGQVGPNLVQPQNVYQFGPFRIAFGVRQNVQGLQQNIAAPVPNHQTATSATGTLPRNANSFPRQGTQTRTVANFSPTTTSTQLQQIEQQLMREVNGLRLQQDQLYLVRALQGELHRLRLSQSHSVAQPPGALLGGPTFTSNQLPQTAATEHQLPTGMTIPDGWTVFPMRRLSGNTVPHTEETRSSSDHNTASEPHTSIAAPAELRETSETRAANPLDVAPPTTRTGNMGSTQQRTYSTLDGNGRHHPMTGQPSEIRKEAPPDELPQSPPDISNWNLGPAVSGAKPAVKHDEVREPDVDSRATAAGNRTLTENLAANGRDKGKGKAVRIEDSNEDDD